MADEYILKAFTFNGVNYIVFQYENNEIEYIIEHEQLIEFLTTYDEKEFFISPPNLKNPDRGFKTNIPQIDDNIVLIHPEKRGNNENFNRNKIP